MSGMRTLSGVALAAAAALAFSTSTVSAGDAGKEEAKVKCEGVNACKGKSACKTANNACKGHNACKGQGFLMMTKEDCKAAKEKIKKMKKDGGEM